MKWVAINYQILSLFTATRVSLPFSIPSSNAPARKIGNGNIYSRYAKNNHSNEALEGFEIDSILSTLDDPLLNASSVSRRTFFSSLLLAPTIAMFSDEARASNNEFIEWSPSPLNKRSGITLKAAEETYNVRFVTYLSRILLNFDDECQRWWFKRASDIPRTASIEQVESIRLNQFGAFSASVEVGLQEYQGENGPKLLMKNLLMRYGNDIEELKRQRSELKLPPLNDKEEEKLEREIREAQRQIALLFGLLGTYQPTEEITKLLAKIDNGSIEEVKIINHGSGYAPGYGSPKVTFPPPEAGNDENDRAQGRAILRPNGKILRVDILNRGFGYSKPPVVSISPPANTEKGGTNEAATAKAYLFRDGINKGRIEKIEINYPGQGYGENEVIKVNISPPELSKGGGGEKCSAKAVLEYEVASIEMTNQGRNYATEKPLKVTIENPPPTSRINLNDPLSITEYAKIVKNGLIPSFDPAIAIAVPVSKSNSYNRFRRDSDIKMQSNPVSTGDGSKPTSSVKISAAGDIDSDTPRPFWRIGNTSSSTLLQLLPSGIGLIYDSKTNRYALVAGDSVIDYDWSDSISPGKPIDPYFGPRGRSPIEREKKLDASTIIRFYLAGAVCCSSVHLLLTPIDVVKTNLQTNPKKYSDPVTTFQLVLEERGPLGFFAGWVPTFFGFFISGGISYLAFEIFRRYYTDLVGDVAYLYEIPIILAASFTSAVLGCLAFAPTESIRIRSVAQPDYAENAIGVAKRMIDEEGISTLFSAVPAFLLKEIPYTITKFTVFDLSTEFAYDKFPAAREDIQLSLLVSLVCGSLAGISAAIVSNPADATISEMKKIKSDDGPITTFSKLVEEGGARALFRGLGVRMIFYTLLVSLQFLVYDVVRFSLGIGSDDLKLYLDVLGGALREKGGPI
jgi:solute carrier family 25 phosphate transporter 3